jgi:hypothetical protein
LFRGAAAVVEQEIRAEFAQSPLVDQRPGSARIYAGDAEARAAAAEQAATAKRASDTYDNLMAVIEAEETTGRDATEYRKKAAELEKLRDAEAVDAPASRQTKVSLFGKAGGRSQKEFEETREADHRRAAVNAATYRKQLVGPLGEVERAKLIGDPSAVTKMMMKFGIKPRKATEARDGDVAKLKQALGQQAVDQITDDKEVFRLGRDYGAKFLERGDTFEGQIASETNVEGAAFAVGAKAAQPLTAQQFLQTGGNEAQIRTKSRLTQ